MANPRIDGRGSRRAGGSAAAAGDGELFQIREGKGANLSRRSVRRARRRRREIVGQNGAEHRHADGRADLPEELARAGGDPQLTPLDGVLGREVEHALRRAQTQTQQRHAPHQIKQARVWRRLGQQEGRQGGRRRAPDHDLLVAAEPVDDEAADGRRRDQTNGQRRHRQAAGRGRQSQPQLHIQRQERHHPHEGHEHQKGRQVGGGERAIAKQVQGDDRIVDPGLDQQESDHRNRGAAQQRENGRRGPTRRPPPAQRQQQRHEGGQQQARAGEIDASADPVRQARHLDQHHEQRQPRQRQIDIEDPPPARDFQTRQMDRGQVGEEAADQRTDDAGETEHRSEQAAHLGALSGRIEVGDHSEGRGDQAGAAQTLDRPEHDQLRHAAADQRQIAELAGQPAQHRADHKQGDADDEDRLAPKDVRQLAVDRHHHRRGQQIGGRHPRIEIQARQLRHDPRHGRGDDGLVERRQQEDDHQGDQRHPPLQGREVLRLRVDGRSRREGLACVGAGGHGLRLEGQRGGMAGGGARAFRNAYARRSGKCVALAPRLPWQGRRR